MSKSPDAIVDSFALHLHTNEGNQHGPISSLVYTNLFEVGVLVNSIYLYVKIDSINNQSNHQDVGAYIRIRYKDLNGALSTWADSLISINTFGYKSIELSGPSLSVNDSIDIYIKADVGSNQNAIDRNYVSFFVDGISFNTPMTPNRIKQLDFDDYFELYPVPAYNYVHTKSLRNVSIVKIDILDLSGKTINSTLQPDNLLDVSAYPNGVYILRISTNKGILRKKITITH